MKIIFWQNIVSPHLSFLYSSVAKEFEVILIVDSLVSEERKKQGWSIPVLKNVEIIVIESEAHVRHLVDKYKYERHVFSGVAGMNRKSLRLAFKQITCHTNVSVFSESPIQTGIKKYVRKLLYRYYYLRDGNKINHIFAVGDIGVQWFLKSGFKKEKLTQFCYFINYDDSVVPDVVKRTQVTELIFIGQLIPRKGCDNLLHALKNIDRKKWNLKIIGTGVEENRLRNMTTQFGLDQNIEFCGTVPSDQIKSYIKSADFLVLPSRFDGWGAVVSEALSVGVKVVCSDKCGSSILVAPDNGFVYKEGSERSLTNILYKVLLNRNYSRRAVQTNFINFSQSRIIEFAKIMKTL